MNKEPGIEDHVVAKFLASELSLFATRQNLLLIEQGIITRKTDLGETPLNLKLSCGFHYRQRHQPFQKWTDFGNFEPAFLSASTKNNGNSISLMDCRTPSW